MPEFARTHYYTLNARPGCTADELRAAWLELAKRYHPDRLAGPQRRMPKAEAHAQEAIRLANLAYSLLKAPQARAAYDATLPLLYAPCPTCKGTGTSYKQQGFGTRIAGLCKTCTGHGWYCKN